MFITNCQTGRGENGTDTGSQVQKIIRDTKE